MTTQQIEVLARFDGFIIHEDTFAKKIVNNGRVCISYYANGEVLKHLTSPGVLIEMRLKLYEMAYRINEIELKYNTLVAIGELGELILNKEYTAAAIKTSEQIQKLEA